MNLESINIALTVGRLQSPHNLDVEESWDLNLREY
jgi:hypothetical protein